MSKQMLIETSADEARVAIVENGRLIDFDIEVAAREKLKGNIYKGTIVNVERSLAAVFVDFGAARQGFLPISEIHHDALYAQRGKIDPERPVAEQLHRHQEVVVQVTKDEVGHKGAALTTYLSIPGRYCVLMHSDDGRGGISRKIEDEEARKKAREFLSKLKAPDGLGVIVRTAGMNRTKVELQRDLSALLKTWRGVERAAKIGHAPTLLYREPDMVVRFVRDFLLPDVEEIVVDNPEEFAEASAFFDATMPRQKQLLRLYQEPVPLFAAYGIDGEIARTWQRIVRLPSGGEIVIDPTEALVAIDVNSSKSTRERDPGETAFRTNLEAADEIARQLRLRDLGGIVVIDFIDHASRKHDRELERRLKEALKADKARTAIGRVSKNGTLELTRQRLRRAHVATATLRCAACGGTGVVPTVASRADEVLRELRLRASRHAQRVAAITAHVAVEVANLLFNERRGELDAIAARTGVRLGVLAEFELANGVPRFDEEARPQPLPAALPAAPPPAAVATSPAAPEPAVASDDDELAIEIDVEIDDRLAPEPLAAVTALPPRPAPLASEPTPAPLDPLSEALFGSGPLPPAGYDPTFGAQDSAVDPIPATNGSSAKRRRRRRGRRKRHAPASSGDGTSPQEAQAAGAPGEGMRT
ncbi:MAG: Rne/Rng family ribonuclease [Deltaproteobacteria bacterium]|nr:Rne/Rng family ribonuclease [Deltaproteobacteria bacterium]